MASCTTPSDRQITINDIRVFENSPVWKLAGYVKEEDQPKIKAFGETHPELLNYKEPRFGTTLLMWAVSMEKYESVLALLQSGADPNIRSNSGATALFKAVSYSAIDNEQNEDAKYVRLLLKYAANPNIPYLGNKKEGVTDPIESGTSPLMHAVSRSLEKTKVLVEGGADINYKTETHQTAAIMALMMQKLDAAYYLIVEKKASVSDPFYFYEFGSDTIANKTYRPVDLLRNWIYDLDSEEYKTKMAIVEEFERQGQDYRSSYIPESTIRRIKKLFPDNWKDYLEKY
jgi:hypothetical protein